MAEEQRTNAKLKKLWPVVDAVLALEDRYAGMSEEDLRAVTGVLKARLAAGETLDELLPDAFAACREASWRVLGKKHYPVQVLGGVVLHRACIAEMRTGEGKTLVAALPACLNALTGKGVHVMTVNDYLAKRDSELLAPVYNYLGLTVGLAAPGLGPEERAAAYAADITYGTNHEFGFDYLRDHLATDRAAVVQRGLACAILDEADSILLDEAGTPLIISTPGENRSAVLRRTDLFARSLQKSVVRQLDTEQELDEQAQGDYLVDETGRTAALTGRGVAKAEWYFGLDNLFSPDNQPLRQQIDQALRAHGVMERDKDYIVREDEVFIVDPSTGRVMPGRRYGNGLHGALEAKEGVTVGTESLTLARITYQNFFRMYQKLAGMTGTALTDADELREVYGLEIIDLPTHRPIARVDHPDLVFRTAAARQKAVQAQIRACHAKGQPVLVGTGSVEKSERLSALLDQNGLPHTVLNAKNHAQEAEIVAKAGQKGAITIATNMAGRGTDILLGEGVHALGGLFVIGVERQESRRVDGQLRGRAGRQGDPGESRFYISLEDDLMRLFGGERAAAALEGIGLEEDAPIKGRTAAAAAENAQKMLEADRCASRAEMLGLDDVIGAQRETIYRERDELLQTEDLSGLLLGLLRRSIRENVERCLAGETPEDWDPDALREAYEGWLTGPEEDCFALRWLEETGPEDLIRQLTARAEQLCAERCAGPESAALREPLLKSIDIAWMQHLEAMDDLRDGIGLRRLAQQDPIVEYRIEGFKLFEEMTRRLRDTLLRRALGPGRG